VGEQAGGETNARVHSTADVKINIATQVVGGRVLVIELVHVHAGNVLRLGLSRGGFVPAHEAGTLANWFGGTQVKHTHKEEHDKRYCHNGFGGKL